MIGHTCQDLIVKSSHSGVNGHEEHGQHFDLLAALSSLLLRLGSVLVALDNFVQTLDNVA